MKMDKERIRKLKGSLVNISLFLSIFAILFPLAMPTLNAVADTLYVGGTGPGNYSTISEAIAASDPGDTIYVYSGTYNEKLTIPWTLTLKGEDRDTTIVQPPLAEPGTVITISASSVTVTGFT